MTTAHAPWSDGQTERTDRLFQDVLRHFVSADMLDWDKHLKIAQFAISNSWQESVQETPKYLNRGKTSKVSCDGETANSAYCQSCIC